MSDIIRSGDPSGTTGNFAATEANKNLIIPGGRGAAATLEVFPSCGRIGENEASDAALTVQMILNALKVRYDCYGFIELTGTLDEPTARALTAFRAAHGVPDEPGVDVDTWNTLAGEYAILREME